MDLPTVKANVKAWEKAFRAAQGRAPTKDDIKSDAGGIKAQYDLYRRLSKEAQASILNGASSSNTALAPPLAQPPSSAASSSFHAASSSAGPSRSTIRTPRVVSGDGYPTTPTPNRRRSSSGTNGRAVTAQATQNDQAGQIGHDAATGEKSSVRPGKRPAPSPQSATRSLFITPKKPRPSYSGPIVDPNPVNPFASTPPRPTPFGSATASGSAHPAPGPPSSAQSNVASASKFVHANSPRKLRELLESNSLRKVRERNTIAEEITPRTKARMRLTGDFVTPMKDKAPRKRRGERAEAGSQADPISRAKGKEAMRMEDDLSEHSDEEDNVGDGSGFRRGEDMDEDEFGPSPMKPGLSRTFTELLQSAEDAVPDPRAKGSGDDLAGRPKAKEKAAVMTKKTSANQRDISSFFGKAIRPKVGQIVKPSITNGAGTGTTSSSAADVSSVRGSTPNQSSPRVDIAAEDELEEERLSTPPPLDPAMLDEASHTPSRSARKEKMVSFSDDEVDEWDPEGGNMRQKVFITGTKRTARRRGSMSSVSSAGGVDNRADADAEARLASQRHAGSDGPHRAEEDIHDEGDGDMADETGSVPDLTNGDTAATPTHSSPRSSVQPPPLPPLLSLLSLRSPPARGPSARMNDLRVKAIFNPDDAARLRAARKGQDIYVAGQVEGEEDEDGDLIDQYQFDGVQADDDGAEGDDDWDDDCDGWKRTGLSMDDEAW